MSASAPRILVIRRRYLGDIVLLGSVFRNLRLHWPRARITVLVEARFAEVLALNPDVDAAFILPVRARSWPGFVRQLRCAGFTHVFDFDNNERTALLGRLSGAPFRATVWHEGTQPRWPRFYTHRHYDPPAVHEQRPITEYYLSLLAAAAVPVVTREIRLTPRAEDHDAARQLFARLFPVPAPAGSPSLLIHPGSRSACRLWPPERFGRICDRVQLELGARVALVAGPGEQALIDGIRRHARQTPAVVDAVLSLPQLAALARRFDVLLCHDSGPMHLAAAVGTRVVALLGSQNPVLFAPPGAGHTVLQPPLPCQHCVAPGECVPGDSYRNYCIRNLSEGDVFAALRAQLARSARPP